MTPQQLERIKERATDLLLEVSPQQDRVAVRATVDLYVRVLDRASTEVLGPKPEVMTEEAMVRHDVAVGIPGWERVG